MPIRLEITAETVKEFDNLLSRFNPVPPAPTVVEPVEVDYTMIRGFTAEEAAASVKPAPKSKRMAREPEAAPTAEPSTAAEPVAASASAEPLGEIEHPLLAEVTLDQIKSKASEVLKKGGESGKLLMDTLKSRFAVEAFSKLAPEQRADALAMMDAML